TPFGIRLAMATEAFRNFSEVVVSDIESSLPLPSYTIYTLKRLKDDYKNDELFLIIGDDEASNIIKWHRYDELKRYANFIITRRYCEKPDFDKKFFENAIVADNPVIEISSSMIRELIKKGVRVNGLVPDNVVKIIISERLYR
ncbi:MAG: nicotinate-nicotinamide nucleotide adenylyltransferase, partial [candidate division WOR-3 bacterium]